MVLDVCLVLLHCVNLSCALSWFLLVTGEDCYICGGGLISAVSYVSQGSQLVSLTSFHCCCTHQLSILS